MTIDEGLESLFPAERQEFVHALNEVWVGRMFA